MSMSPHLLRPTSILSLLLCGALASSPALAVDASSLHETAQDQTESLSARLKATKALRRAAKRDRNLQLDAWLLEVRLRGLQNASKKRAGALKKAKRAAKKAKNRRMVSSIARVQKGDVALRKLERALAKNVRRATFKAPRRLSRDVKTVRASLRAWAAIGDSPRNARAKVALLELSARKTKRPARVLRTSTKLLRVGGVENDTRSARADVRRIRSALLAQMGQWRDAAHESLVADRIRSPEGGLYLRTRVTARTCQSALTHGVDCAQIEDETMGNRSHYDFSKERTRRFSVTRANAVRADYEGEIGACILDSGELSEIDREARFTWRVDQDGRVTDYDVYPRFFSAGKLGRCLDKAFDAFRYPRFKGASPTLELSYDLDLRG